MEKIMQSLINNWVRGMDTYTHNGSTWLIFTDSKRWVIELTEDKTLWYNYNFFKQIFSLTSLDVVQNQHLITKWVEDNVMNKVNYTFSFEKVADYRIEDTLENGVKETKISPTHTEYGDWLDGDERLDEIIKNGVKETNSTNFPNGNCGYIKEILRKGIKTVQPLPAQDGNRDWGNYYHGKEDRTKPFNEYLNEAIEFGVIPKFFLSIHKNYYEHTELFDF